MKLWWNEFCSWWKTNVFHGTKKILRVVGTLFIPFFYGFIYIFAFWNPLSLTKNLAFALVNRDNTQFSKSLEKTFAKESSRLAPFQLTLSRIKPSYYAERKNDYYGGLVIPKNFSQDLDKYLANPSQYKNPEIIFNFSFKKNFLIAEGNSLIANELKLFINVAIIDNEVINIIDQLDKVPDIKALDALLERLGNLLGPYFQNFINLIQKILNEFPNPPQIKQLVKLLKEALNNFLQDIKKLPSDQVLDNLLGVAILKSNVEGQQYRNYGFGLGPYFISIALWIGLLSQTFWLFGTRKTLKFVQQGPMSKGRWLFKCWKVRFLNFINFWTFSFIITIFQIFILLTGLSLIGYVVTNQFYLFLFGLIMAFAFSVFANVLIWIVDSVNIGRLLIILVFVFQLVSSNGTFPVSMENGFFQGISPFLPFTHTIALLRELLVNTRPDVVLVHCLYLVLISLFMFCFSFVTASVNAAITYKTHDKFINKNLAVHDNLKSVKKENTNQNKNRELK